MTDKQKQYQREITRMITDVSRNLSREDAITLLCNIMQTSAVVIEMLNSGHAEEPSDV